MPPLLDHDPDPIEELSAQDVRDRLEDLSNRRESERQDPLLKQANQMQDQLQAAFMVWIGIALVYFIGAVDPRISSSVLTFTYILFGIYWPTFFIYLGIRFGKHNVGRH